MKRKPQRRAFTLMEIIGALPVLMALIVAAYGLTSNAEYLHSREGARRQAETRVRDIIRRIQEDAGRAAEAQIADTADGRQLSLRSKNGSITYASVPGRTTRTEQTGDGNTIRYAWTLDNTNLDYQLETIGPGSRLVWIRCTMDLPFDLGPGMTGQLSAAAPVGKGGVR